LQALDDYPGYAQEAWFSGKRGMSEDRQERFAAYVEALAGGSVALSGAACPSRSISAIGLM